MSLDAHAQAVLALLYATPDLTVYPKQTGGSTTAPPEAQPPYVTVHLAADRPLGGRLAMQSTKIRVRIYVHCTGGSDQAARLLADKVATALLDVRPVVDGRTANPIRHETTHPPDPDESTGSLASTLTDVYLLQTEPSRL